MTNSGFFQLFDRHEREDYNATLSEAAIRQMISEEFEEADKIISAGFDKGTLQDARRKRSAVYPDKKVRQISYAKAYRLPAAILSRSLVL